MKTCHKPIAYLSLLILNMCIIACANQEQEKALSLLTLEPVILKAEGNEIHQYWEFENNSILWSSQLGNVNYLIAYRDSLQILLGDTLLEKTIAKESTQTSNSTLPDSANGDQRNAHLVHSGKLGRIQEINFLEAELLNYQLNRYQLLNHPTEFHAFVLSNDSLNLIRAYYAASDQPWPPRPSLILSQIEKDQTNGWSLIFDLHNHYEDSTNNYIGILAPSMSDAQFFKALAEDYQMPKAFITNGFHTVKIDSSEFDLFEAHGN